VAVVDKLYFLACGALNFPYYAEYKSLDYAVRSFAALIAQYRETQITAD
jgi:hypothetical protein